jgi:hypothetical protein
MVLITAFVVPATLFAVMLGFNTPTRTHLTGYVLSVGADGKFAFSAPDGSGVVTAPGNGLTQDAADIVLAANGRYLLTPTGRLMRLSGDSLLFTGNSVLVRPGQTVAGLADQNRAVITIGIGHSATYPVYATHFGQPSISMGEADSVAGDPQQTGVIVSVGSSQLSNPGSIAFPDQNLAFPMMDVRVELRDAGHSTVLLDRASQLNAALREPPTTPVQIIAVPSPSGQLFALEVIPLSSGAPSDGIVVVDRHGTIVGTAAGLHGDVSWSPDGQSLTYPQIVGGHFDMAVWTIGHQPELYQGPKAVSITGLTCVWAPTGRAVLCAVGGDPIGRNARWLVAQLHQSHVATYSGPLLPLAWLPGPTPGPNSHGQ